jgi:hypothetical protein
MEGHIVGMEDGGKKLKYTPAPRERVYSDNTRVVTPTPTSPLPTAKANITSSLKDKAYQLPKYESKKEINPTVKRLLNSADMATDVLQLGHFSPDPFMIGQTAGLIGDVVGAGVDAVQSGIDAYEGNYGNAALNLGLSVLPGQTKKLGYERPSSLLTGKGSGMYRPLTATTPALAQNPIIKKGLNWNRGTLAANLTELGSNTGLPNMPTTNAQTQKEYQDNAKTVPLLKRPGMQMGGLKKMPMGGITDVNSKGDFRYNISQKVGNVTGSLQGSANVPTMTSNYMQPKISYDRNGLSLSKTLTGFGAGVRGDKAYLDFNQNQEGKDLYQTGSAGYNSDKINLNANATYKNNVLDNAGIQGNYNVTPNLSLSGNYNISRGETGMNPEYFAGFRYNKTFKEGGKVDHSNDDDMVNGVASILRRVKDKKNRLQLANQMSSQFKREKVKYNLNDFLNKSKVKK